MAQHTWAIEMKRLEVLMGHQTQTWGLGLVFIYFYFLKKMDDLSLVLIFKKKK
jgi:hypothetical protein